MLVYYSLLKGSLWKWKLSNRFSLVIRQTGQEASNMKMYSKMSFKWVKQTHDHIMSPKHSWFHSDIQTAWDKYTQEQNLEILFHITKITNWTLSTAILGDLSVSHLWFILQLFQWQCFEILLDSGRQPKNKCIHSKHQGQTIQDVTS